MNLKSLVDALRANPNHVTTFATIVDEIEKCVASQVHGFTAEQNQYVVGLAVGAAMCAKSTAETALAKLDQGLREHVAGEIAKLRDELVPHIAH